MVKARVLIQNRGNFRCGWIFTTTTQIERDYDFGFLYDFESKEKAEVFLEYCLVVSMYRSGCPDKSYRAKGLLEEAERLYPELFIDESCNDVIYKSNRSWG